MTYLLYPAKVFLCSGILFGYYWLFLRNRRFHHYNRFYLLGSLLLSVILPLFKIQVWYQPESTVTQVVYETINVLSVNYGETEGLVNNMQVVNSLFTVENSLYAIYIAGIVVLLWMLAKSVLYIKRISRHYPFERISELKFYTTQEPGTPFSFFRSIFWSNDLPFNSREGQQVFRHELFHVQQKHSTDIIFTELVTALFWYNPFFHMLKKELKAIHEFLADQYAVSGNDRYAYAELLVMQTIKAGKLPVTNHFFQNHIKRRIAMITNLTSSKKYGYFSRLMILPVSVLLFCTIVLYAQQPKAQVTTAHFTGAESKPITVVIDAGHGGSDNGSVSADGSAKEKDIALQISLKIQQLAPSYNVNVIMTRTGNDLPANTTVVNDGLRARTTIAEQSKADAFVSIHMSAITPEMAIEEKKAVNDWAGIEVFITRGNEKWMESSKALGSSVLQTLSSWYTTYPSLKQRKEKGIWVLDHSPCPAVLIECGFITNDKDLAFFAKDNNQEALAKKILEGIANYKNQQPATNAAIPDNKEIQKQVSQTQPEIKTTSATDNKLQVQFASYTTTASPDIEPALQQSVVEKNEDSVLIMKLSRHFNRNTHYPKAAFDYNIEGTVYYSLVIDESGRISDFQAYSQIPATTQKIHTQVVVGYQPYNPALVAGKLSSEEQTIIFQDEVKRVFERNVDLSGSAIKEPGKYYFKTVFRLEKPQQKNC